MEEQASQTLHQDHTRASRNSVNRSLSPLVNIRESVDYVGMASLVPRLLPYRQMGREPGRSDHVHRDVLCVLLIIELLPTQPVPLSVSVLSGTRTVVTVLDQWLLLRLQMGTGRLFHYYLASW